jgi:hypothetical protein
MAMDHAEALERIEVAAAEPGGLDRLAAGDTADASIVAGHIAGCASCADALIRTTRTAEVARAVIRDLPDPALRARTLALVREVGRDRSGIAAASSIADLAPVAAVASARGARVGRGRWLVPGLAAAVVIAAVVGFAAGGVARQPAPASGDLAYAVSMMQATMRIAARPDAVSIALAPAAGGAAAGTVMYSPTSGELAMVVTGLAAAPDGWSYSCWIESGGTRRKIGVVYADHGSGAWAGPIPGLVGLAPGSTFGVSLVSANGQPGTQVLAGR